MRILALDTAGSGCSVCLWQDGTVLSRRGGTMERGQAEALMPMVVEVMAQVDGGWPAVDRLAVTVGPGSFTGLRVGLSAARAMGLAAGKPVIGLTTLEVFAHAVPGDLRAGADAVAVVVDARREDIYVQLFDAGGLAPLSEPAAMPPADVAVLTRGHARGSVVVTGDAVDLVADALGAAGVKHEAFAAAVPDVVVLARLAATRPLPSQPPSALYIRPPDAALPTNGGQLRP